MILYYIINKEKEIINNKTISEEEKCIILITATIAEYSCEFAISHFASDTKGRKPGWWQRTGKKIVKADAAGALGGIIAGALDGTIAAGAAAGGVAGAIGATLGSATIGAISSSIVATPVAIATTN